VGDPTAAGPPSPDRRRLLLALGFGAANAIALSRIARGRPGQVSTGTTPTAAARGPQTPPALEGAAPEPVENHLYDVVITGGRVIDPETGFDQVANVGIDGPTIVAIGDKQLNSRMTIDAKGRVVAPGFIDLISYDPNPYGIWFKVADGVTTNLGMHGMLMSADQFFGTYAQQGSPCHYGGAYDNYYMRGVGQFQIGSGEAATPQELDQLAADIESQLHQGWLGASFSPEYSPGITDDEITRQAAVAAKYGLPTFFHGRYSTDIPPDDNAKTLQEIIDVARATGAAAHVMHITSTGGTFQMQQALDTIHQARDQHLDISACLYPYNFWATYIQSARFDDGWQQRFHIDYGDLVVPGTGERLTKARFDELRSASTNKLVAAYAIPDADVVTALQSPMTMIGSDAILTQGDNNHPRGAGCFSRALGHYVREQKTLSLIDALAKMTILPAKRLEAKAPALQKKGRLQRGADADITIFDPATVADRATVEDPSQSAAGIDYVIVSGTIVLTPDGPDKSKLPGQPIKSVI
jgi:N-acyl-D-aspartate/D-glutamate deacylase